MTESEAIEAIQFDLKIGGEIHSKVLRDAVDVAIQALEKQVPKKPTPIDYEKYIDVIDNARFLRGAYWCPDCNRAVKSGSFCSDCGQKLDWSDENEISRCRRSRKGYQRIF